MRVSSEFKRLQTFMTGFVFLSASYLLIQYVSHADTVSRRAETIMIGHSPKVYKLLKSLPTMPGNTPKQGKNKPRISQRKTTPALARPTTAITVAHGKLPKVAPTSHEVKKNQNKILPTKQSTKQASAKQASTKQQFQSKNGSKTTHLSKAHKEHDLPANKSSKSPPTLKNNKVMSLHTLVYQHCNKSGCLQGSKGFNKTLLKLYNFTKIEEKLLPKLTLPIISQFIFVTASSIGHFKEDLDAIAGIQHNFPKRKIIFYDIGLHPKQVKIAKSLCAVEFRKFNFDKFPEHIHKFKLGNFAWKMMIIKEVLETHTGVFWVDSSVRFNTVNFTQTYNNILKNDGALIATRGMTMIHPGMLEYFPLNHALFKKRFNGRAGGGGAGFYYRTKINYDTFLKWAFLCALTVDCISPPGSSAFCPKGNAPKGCVQHRFDQAMLNVLLAIRFNMQPNTYFKEEHLLNIKRQVTGQYNITFCDKDSHKILRTYNVTSL